MMERQPHAITRPPRRHHDQMTVVETSDLPERLAKIVDVPGMNGVSVGPIYHGVRRGYSDKPCHCEVHAATRDGVRRQARRNMPAGIRAQPIRRTTPDPDGLSDAVDVFLNQRRRTMLARRRDMA